MAQLEKYHNTNVDTLSPSDGALSKEHEEQRLIQAQESAAHNVNRVDPEGLGDFLKQNESSNTADLVSTFRNRLLGNAGILDTSAQNYTAAINNSSVGGLEKILLQNTRISVLDKIKNISARGKVSLSAIEAYEVMLLEAKTSIEEQIEPERKRLEEVVGKKNLLEKILSSKWGKRIAVGAGVVGAIGAGAAMLPIGAGLLGAAATTATTGGGVVAAGGLGAYLFGNNKDRQNNKNTKKLDSFDDKFAIEIEKIEHNLATLKADAISRRDHMASIIKSKFDATHDPAIKADLWAKIKSVSTGTAHRRVDLSAFGLGGNIDLAAGVLDQKVLDFLEACKNTDWIKDAISGVQESKQNIKNQRENLQAANTQHRYLRTANKFDFIDAITGCDIYKKIETSTQTPTTAALLEMLVRYYSGQGQNVEGLADIVDAMRRGDMLTDEVRLVAIFNAYINSGRLFGGLPIDIQRNIKAWIEERNRQSVSGGEGMEYMLHQDRIRDHFEALQSRGGVLKKGADTIAELQRAVTQPRSDAQFNDFETSYRDFSTLFTAKYNEFSRDKDTYPETHRHKLEEIWAKAEEARKQLRETLDNCLQAQRHWPEYNTQAQTAAAEGSPTLFDRIGSENRPKHKALLEQKLEALKTAADLPDIQSAAFADLTSELASLQNMDFKENPNVILPQALKKRIQHSLIKDFGKNIESRFLANMEKNDSFHLLLKTPEGARVKLDYKASGVATSLDFPQGLSNAEVAQEFIIIKKTDSAVLLKNNAGNKTLSIVSPAVKDGKPGTNAILSNANGAGTSLNDPSYSGAGTPTIAFNIRL